MKSKASVPLTVIEDSRRASVMLDPLRLKILEGLREPNSASGLAHRFGIARQKINYHLRELEKLGLLEMIEERRKGNCTERIVRAVARSYLISPEALGSLASDPDQIQDRFSSAYLVAVAARAIQDLALLKSKAEKSNQKVATFNLQTEIRFASAADRNHFAEELASCIAKLTAKYHDEKAPGGRLFRVFLGAYPAVTHNKSGGTTSRRNK
jgi:DNA-binding transcriptional ArsR family regulator